MFSPMPAPGSSDWLIDHPESGQMFKEYITERGNPLSKNQNRQTIYLVPMGEWTKEQDSFLASLVEYVEAFYCLPVVMMKPISIKDEKITTRINGNTDKLQLKTPDLMKILSRMISKYPKAYCMLGITMEDLYPDETWNYVFGIASYSNKTGVYSFARYDPHFWDQERTSGYESLLLRRSCKVCVHELGHQFGLHHCIYYSCLMNGSNHLEESDSKPFHMCPVCFRKLHFTVGFDIIKREEKLLEFMKKYKFDDEVEWITKRIKWISGENSISKEEGEEDSISKEEEEEEEEEEQK